MQHFYKYRVQILSILKENKFFGLFFFTSVLTIILNLLIPYNTYCFSILIITCVCLTKRRLVNKIIYIKDYKTITEQKIINEMFSFLISVFLIICLFNIDSQAIFIKYIIISLLSYVNIFDMPFIAPFLFLSDGVIEKNITIYKDKTVIPDKLYMNSDNGPQSSSSKPNKIYNTLPPPLDNATQENPRPNKTYNTLPPPLILNDGRIVTYKPNNIITTQYPDGRITHEYNTRYGNRISQSNLINVNTISEPIAVPMNSIIKRVEHIPVTNTPLSPQVPNIPIAEVPQVPNIPVVEEPQVPSIPVVEAPQIPNISITNAPQAPNVVEDAPLIPQAPNVPVLPQFLVGFMNPNIEQRLIESRQKLQDEPNSFARLLEEQRQEIEVKTQQEAQEKETAREAREEVRLEKKRAKYAAQDAIRARMRASALEAERARLQKEEAERARLQQEGMDEE